MVYHTCTHQWSGNRYLQVQEKKHQYAVLSISCGQKNVIPCQAHEFSIHKVFISFLKQSFYNLCYSVLCRETWLTRKVTFKFYVPNGEQNQAQYIPETQHPGRHNLAHKEAFSTLETQSLQQEFIEVCPCSKPMKLESQQMCPVLFCGHNVAEFIEDREKMHGPIYMEL